MTGLRSGLPARDRIVHSPYVIPLPKPDLSLSGRLVRLSLCERRWLYRKCCGFGGRLGRSLFGFGRLLVWDDLSGLGIYYGIRSLGLCEANKQGIELRESRVRAFVFLLGVAFLVLAERKVMAFVQRRKGPDVVGSFGLLQPLADGLKLILKEPISPSSANFSLFRMAPVATFMLSLVARAVVPFDYGMVLSDSNIGLLYLFAISSLGVYGIITAGWSSN
ncbi:NADH dehydrogenase subunit 1 (mitochondrion) [Lathyrus oleraceus]|nr:NADH dehydrogenase subunit 1 [Pisum sativum]